LVGRALSCTTGRKIPGANKNLEGAVPTGILVPAYGTHLYQQATEDPHLPSALTAPPASLIEEKDRLRRSAGQRRSELAAAEAPAVAGARAADQFMTEFSIPAGTIVSAYWPMGDELDPRPLIRRLQAAGHVIGLPVVVAKGAPLTFRAWTPETRFVPGGFKTEVPETSAPEVVPNLLLVPLLAFDQAGYRLGYGGGFYDRTLAKLRALAHVTAVGFAYEGQSVDAVPRAEYDQPLDAIATERSYRWIG
jgi:5-formyltetrahydrofolate cyclo-ligase